MLSAHCCTVARVVVAVGTAVIVVLVVAVAVVVVVAERRIHRGKPIGADSRFLSLMISD